MRFKYHGEAWRDWLRRMSPDLTLAAFAAAFVLAFYSQTRSLGAGGSKMTVQVHDTPTSSNIVRTAYHANGELHVAFKSGATHIYSGVPAHVFLGLKEAKSAGGFFAANIKGKYSSTKK